MPSANSNNSNSIPTGKCPLIGKEAEVMYSRVLETNDPNNQTQIICKYYHNGKLEDEVEEYKIGGIKHGLFLHYYVNYASPESRVHFLHQSGYYNNGKKVGVWKGYHQPDQLTGVQLEEGRTEYNNDVKLLEEHYYNVPSKQLRVRTKYNNGKPLENTFFYKNGQMEWRIIRDLNGTKVSEEKWYENGRKK